MKQKRGISRRELLWGGARAAPLLGVAVFARHFLRAPFATSLIPGHYDLESQLFVSDETGKPILVADGNSAGTTRIQYSVVVTGSGSKDNPDHHDDRIADSYHTDQ